MSEFKMPGDAEMQEMMARIRRERSAAYAAGIRKAARFVANVVRGTASALAEARRQRNLYEELSRLTDRQLKDIGLTRSDIPAVVAGVLTRNAGTAKPQTAVSPANDGAKAPATAGERLAA